MILTFSASIAVLIYLLIQPNYEAVSLLRIEPVVEGKPLKAGNATLVATKPAWMRLDDKVTLNSAD